MNYESEDEIGQTGRGGLVCRTAVRGKNQSYFKQSSAELAPGSTIRVSVGANGRRSKNPKMVARILAFVHPTTGKLVVRMGMFDIAKSSHGRQSGPQVVWESDVPVYEVENE